MNTIASTTWRERLPFLRFVVGCALFSYPLGFLWYKPEAILSPWRFLLALGKGYMELWFSYPMGGVAWLVCHTLFLLSCLWWLRNNELRVCFFTLLLGASVSIGGAMIVRILSSRHYYHYIL